MKNKKLFLLFFGIFIFMIIPKNVNATATGLRVYQRNSDNTGWQMNANLNTICYLNQNAAIRGQLIRFDFNDTLTNGENYTLSFNISTQSTLDYAYFRWDNSFNSGGILRGSHYLQPQEPGTKQTLATSSMPMGNYTLYSKSSKIAFDVTPTDTGTFSLDLPTYLLSYTQICLDGYSIQKGSSSGTGDSQAIINNNNQNTQTIINNNNQNTSSIIENQNQNTDKEIESQKVCKTITKNNVIETSKFLNQSGVITSSQNFNWGITDYIKVNNSTIKVIQVEPSTNPSVCFYNTYKSLISCVSNSSLVLNNNLSLPSGAHYARFSILTNTNVPQFEICKNGNQALSDDLNDLNNNITSDNVDSPNANANANIEGFEINTHGLGDIFNTIVTFIGNVANSTCSPLQFTLPFVHNQVTLPCMSSVYNQYPTFFTLYQLITTGLIAYRVIINLFQKVKQLSDPSYDKIEVIQL